ncbi:MAG TPA: GDP-mannose pyrophosphatase NudK [Flavisolibacter sp.]|jgi:nudix-type nucleoside diphosphatase (YffH/AdpP family)|nr:GDP-mannose pyrophosphatase NudK [Flavisolibacter sp.]
MNENIRHLQTEILSDNWYTLKKVTYEYRNRKGEWQAQSREAYDRGNGAVILLYNRSLNTVLLTRQFRMPTYLNGNENGLLIEACAGLLDQDNPEDCIRRETEEETGYQIREVTRLFEAYMSPGSVTEILHFFMAEYSPEMQIHSGGGVAHETEDIEVLEIPFPQAIEMMRTGAIKDAKTLLLLQYAQLHELLRASGA